MLPYPGVARAIPQDIIEDETNLSIRRVDQRDYYAAVTSDPIVAVQMLLLAHVHLPSG
ncbi:MAG TPA: hypothetical protein VN697_00105 [Tepidiformaceae bacterium]|nr:hypothetical protein [Tepidiformaceae bacterium]